MNNFNPFRPAGIMGDAADWIIPNESGLPKHVTTFSGVLNTFGRLYSQRFDEALKSGGLQDAQAMKRDCYLLALLRERMRPTSQRKWAIRHEDPKDIRAQQIATVVTKAIERIPSFTRMRFSLLHALWYGRYGAALEWGERNFKGELWKVPVKWRPVNGDKIAFDWDMTPAVAVNPMLATNYASRIIRTDTIPFLKLSNMQWRRQFCLHTHEVEDADYSDITGAGAVAGTGIRGQIYWAWWLRDECLAWAINYMQKVGTMGLLVFWYDQNNEDAQAAAKQAAINASSQNVLVMPRPMGESKQTWDVTQLSASTNGIDALMRIIAEYFERHIERLIIGQSLSAGEGSGGLGGAGVAMLHRDTKFQILAMDSANLDESLTRDLVHPIIAANVPDYDPAEFKFVSIIPDPSQADALNALIRIWERVPVPEEEVYRVAGIRIPKEGEKTIGGPVLDKPGPDGQLPPEAQEKKAMEEEAKKYGDVVSVKTGDELKYKLKPFDVDIAAPKIPKGFYKMPNLSHFDKLFDLPGMIAPLLNMVRGGNEAGVA